MANFYGQQFDLPSSAEFGYPRPLLYAKTLWPFPPSFVSPNSDSTNAKIANQYHQNTAALPYDQLQQSLPPPPYQNLPIWPSPQRRHNGPIGLEGLIAQLSLSIVRSLAQMLAEREMGAVPRHEMKKDKDRGKIMEPISETNWHWQPLGDEAEKEQQQLNDGAGNSKGRPFGNESPAQSVPSPAAVGVSSTKYDYGLKAGLFFGHYGTSESIVSPLGPYGPLNSQIGGSYGGLSQWPSVFGRPQSSESVNSAFSAYPTKALRLAQTTARQRLIKQQQNGDGTTTSARSTPPQMKGEGTVVQIPLGENVQGEDEEGKG